MPETELVEKKKIYLLSSVHSASLTVCDVIITYGVNVPELLQCVHIS